MKKDFPIGEYALYVFIMVVGIELLAAMDAFEWLYDFSRLHEELEMDELFFILPMAMLCMVIFAFRRSREVRIKNKELEKASRELEAAYVRMEEISQSRQRFMNVASHELKAPLSAAVSALKLARDADDEQDVKKMAELALKGLDNLQLLVGDVIRLANLSQDLETDDHVPFSIRSTLESVVRIGGEPARDKGLALAMTVDEDVPQRLVGNEGWTRLICLKLVGNAIKFTAEGGITIRCGYRTAPRKALEIVVSDTGQGVPDDKLDSVFDPYVQGGASVRMQQGGMGLGLATAKELAERMDGSISVRNAPEGGSAFTVILPVELP